MKRTASYFRSGFELRQCGQIPYGDDEVIVLARLQRLRIEQEVRVIAARPLFIGSRVV